MRPAFAFLGQRRGEKVRLLYALLDATERFVDAAHLLFIAFVASAHIKIGDALVHPLLCSFEDEQDAG